MEIVLRGDAWHAGGCMRKWDGSEGSDEPCYGVAAGSKLATVGILRFERSELEALLVR